MTNKPKQRYRLTTRPSRTGGTKAWVEVSAVSHANARQVAANFYTAYEKYWLKPYYSRCQKMEAQ
jgi:hypothetical protein